MRKKTYNKLKMFRILIIYSLLLGITITGFSACTTIRVNERDAFDAKRTVTAEDFRNRGIDLEENVIFSDDTTAINAWYMRHSEARGTVLYLGGNGFLLAIAGDILGAIYEQGVDVLSFDYRGYGQSSGNPSVSGLKRDAQAAYDYLIEQKNINPSDIIIHGHSMGTLLALWLANKNPAAGLVLECPITNADDLTNRLVPFLLKPFVSFDIDDALMQLNNSEEILKLEKPILLIAGQNDQITPKEMAEDLYENAPVQSKRLIIITGAGHNDLPQNAEYKRELSAFYIKNYAYSPN